MAAVELPPVQRVRATSATTLENGYYPQRAIQWVRVREFRSHEDLLEQIQQQQQQQQHSNVQVGGTALNRIYKHHHHHNHHHNHNHHTSPKTRRRTPEVSPRRSGSPAANRQQHVFECHQPLKTVVRSPEMNVLVYNSIPPLTFYLPILLVQQSPPVDQRNHSRGQQHNHNHNQVYKQKPHDNFDDTIPFSANTTVMSYKKVPTFVVFF